MREYAAVLLDVDGTLVDSNDAHAHAWAEALADAGLDVPYARVRRLIGMGGDVLIETVGGPARGTRANRKLGERRGDIFRERWLPRVKPLNKTRELILQLGRAGYHYAIASAAKDDELRPLLELADIADLCPLQTSSDDVEHSKPEPDIVEAALARVPAERHRTVMFGDTEYDIRACRAANVAIIGTTTGGWPAEALAGAVAVYDGPADLLARWAKSPLG